MMGVMGLGLAPAHARSRSSSYNWAQHFAAGQQGYVLLPSRRETLFQDDSGRVPLTAAGQTVGMALDVSRGLALGSELVAGQSIVAANGNSSVSIVGDTVTVSAIANGTYGALVSGLTATAGLHYQIGYNALISPGRPMFVDFGGVTASAGTVTGVRTVVTRRTTTTAPVIIYVPGALAGESFSFSRASLTVRTLAGNHFTQATAGSRPAYQVDGSNLGHLLFDGVNDFMSSGTITPGSDKVWVMLGLRKLSDAAFAVSLEASATANVNSGSFMMTATPSGGLAAYLFQAGGSNRPFALSPASFAAPITNIVEGLSDISGDTLSLWVNGTQVASSTNDQGTGNFLAYPHFLGMRNGASSAFNGRIYGAFVRYGALPSADERAAARAAMNAATGAF